MNNIELLKSLTQNTYDSVEGYRLASEKTESPALRTAFERRLKSRRESLEKLNDALAKNGQLPITKVSIAGEAHQTFLKIADSLTEGDSAALKRVSEGENYLATAFKKALERDDIDTSMRMLLERVAHDVMTGDNFSELLEEQYA